MSRFPALAELPFRRYFIGQSIALVGGFAHNVALTWLAYRLSGSTLVLGIVGFTMMAPTLLVSPILAMPTVSVANTNGAKMANITSSTQEPCTSYNNLCAPTTTKSTKNMLMT